MAAILSFHSRQKKSLKRGQGTFNKMNLIYTAETKFLGVHITELLEWNTHVLSLMNKLSKVSFMIKSLKMIMSPFMISNISCSKSSHFYSLEYYFVGGRRVIQIKKYLEYKNDDKINVLS